MTVEGIDISGHNGKIDWQAVKEAGIEFAFIKATEGDAYVDGYFATNIAQCRALRITCGAYHFYRHDIDPTAQAQHFAHIMGRPQPGDLLPAVDVEAPGDGAGRISYPSSQIVERLATFLDIVHAATGLACIIYTYPYMWRNIIGNSNTFAGTNKLWLAKYDGPPQTPLVGNWADYSFWQYTDNGTVPGVGLVDRDRFNGDAAELPIVPITGHNPVRNFPPPFDPFILYGEFRTFFEANGDVAAFGNPITNTRQELIDGTVYPYVQWFERARMEWHPTENKVFLGLVGVEALRANDGSPEDGAAIDADFAPYYAANGGVSIFGLPLGKKHVEVVSGLSLQVQYFERARLELNPATNEISRGLVGSEALAAVSDQGSAISLMFGTKN
jgi:lysozyme